jgi:hypothetical protein
MNAGLIRALGPIAMVGVLATSSVRADPSVLFLNRCPGACGVKTGDDDARAHVSSIPAGGNYVLGEFGWGDTAWNELLQCVREVYSPYDVTVTDIQPAPGVVYNESLIAGTAASLGMHGIGGISLLSSDCSPYHNTMSFVFANTHGPGDVIGLCWVVAQETGHAFGLDHAFEFSALRSACIDPMSYRTDCGGQRFFRNQYATCGEFGPRACACGQKQSSHAHLLEVLGPGTPITTAPVVEVVSPHAGDQIAYQVVTVKATAQRGVATIELWLNGAKWATSPGAEFGPTGQPSIEYVIGIPQNVPDGVIDLVVTAKDDIGVATSTPPITVVKGEPCTSAASCAVDQFCEAGRCFWGPPLGEFGESCSYEQYCKSGLCAGNGVDTMCTETCDVDAPNTCPGGYTCFSTPALYEFPAGVCWPTEQAAGCCDARNGLAHPALPIILFALCRRRRVRSR